MPVTYPHRNTSTNWSITSECYSQTNATPLRWSPRQALWPLLGLLQSVIVSHAARPKAGQKPTQVVLEGMKPFPPSAGSTPANTDRMCSAFLGTEMCCWPTSCLLPSKLKPPHSFLPVIRRGAADLAAAVISCRWQSINLLLLFK